MARRPLTWKQSRDLIGYQQSWLGKNRRPPPPKERKRRKLTGRHSRLLLDGAIAILREGDPTKFAFEAFCRHGIRAGLCMKGWTWARADAYAADVVAKALATIGATRPTWDQAQHDWTAVHDRYIERTRCIRCTHNLPDGHKKFCSSICRSGFHGDIERNVRRAELAALEYADAA